MSQNVENVESQFLPIVEDIQSQSIYLDEQNQNYEITNVDELKNRLVQLNEVADHYIYNEEDRQSIKKFKAQVNKFSKQFTKMVNEEKELLFGKVNKDKKEIVDLLNDIQSKVNQGIIAEDKRYKDEKKAELEDAFVEAKSSYDHIAQSEITYDSISKSSWLNRSMSKSKALEEMTDRVQSIDSMLSSIDEMNREANSDQVIQFLNKYKWNSLNALNQLKIYFEEEDARIEKAIKEKEEREKREKEQSQQEKEDNLEQNHEHETISLIISAKDLSKVKSALRRLNVSYELGE